jgi:hypothetical protein
MGDDLVSSSNGIGGVTRDELDFHSALVPLASGRSIASTKRVPIPAPMARLNLGEVEVNAVWRIPRDSCNSSQTFFESLRFTSPVNPPMLRTSTKAGLTRGHHDVLLRLANGFSDDFGQRGQQRLPLILSQGNGGFDF